MAKPNVNVYLKLKVSKEGKCVYWRRYKSRSFVANFVSIMSAGIGGPSVNIQNAAPNTGSIGVGSKTGIFLNTGDTGADQSIQVGSGTAAPTISDTSIGQLIQSGTSTGQLSYSTTTVGSIVTNSSTNCAYFPIVRQFTNNSGAPITVSEVALVLQIDGTSGYALILHDLLSNPVTLSNGSVLTVTYQIQVCT